jgi:hypothetical protein
MNIKIVSGGQTGVDRAALDVALALGISCGGWCPRGRLAEDGRIPDRYPLKETATPDVAVRTEFNVANSDGTLILALGKPSGGTLFTIHCAQHHRRPWLESTLENPLQPEVVHRWLVESKIEVLNVAGPRESQKPGFVYNAAKRLIEAYLCI